MAYKLPLSFPLVALILSLLATAFTTSAGIKYRVINKAVGTPGGDRFNANIGVRFTKLVLADASSFVRTTFAMPNGGVRNDVKGITCVIEATLGVPSIVVGNEIRVSAKVIENMAGSEKIEFTGILFHAVTHVWQWVGDGEPRGLVEGMADYVRLKAGYPQPNWVFPGQGDRWDQGYDVTARFLDYCSRFDSRFVAKLNAKMKHGYDVGVFKQLLGKPVEQLFEDYKGILP